MRAPVSVNHRLSFFVAVGDEVKEGDGVIVIEAMKMENELKAGIDGVVKEILVEEGKAVEGGTMLVVIE